MKQITVKKDELLKVLKDNRKEHQNLVWKAQEGFKIAAKEKLEELLEQVKKNKLVEFFTLHELNQPMDKTEDYDRAIQMLEMEVEDEVKVSESEFRCYVQDKWGWTDQMLLSNTKYTGH